MEKLKITIVTPSYNQGQFIEETILSVINQGYENLEFIIIDGGSTDNTVEIIKKYEKHITYWVSEKDNGQTHAINKGFKLATGDIIAWINSDDLYCDGALKAIGDFFEKNTEAHVVVGTGLFMNVEGKIYIRKHPNISRWLEKYGMMSIFQPSTFFKRSVLADAGYPDEEYQMMMDAEWYCRINRQFPFHVINKDISIFRWHPASKSSSEKNSKLQALYRKEQLALVKALNPSSRRFVDSFPKASFFLYIKTGNLARLLRRFFKGELYKLNDTKNLNTVRRFLITDNKVSI
ncbi:MAG: glycosyltransferase family 2 protein [Chitinophagaceae bacterium]